MQQILNLINKRVQQHFPANKSFDYTRYYIIWYKVAEELKDEFTKNNLHESAASVAAIIKENINSGSHDRDRHIILSNLNGNY